MITLTFVCLIAAFVAAVMGLAGKWHPSIGVLLLVVLEALRVLPR